MQTSASSRPSSAVPRKPTAAPMPAPPPHVIPLAKQHCTYTRQYCEENIYLLAQQLLRRLPDAKPASAVAASLSPPAASVQKADSAASDSVAPASSLLPTVESLYASQLGEEQLFVVFISSAHSEFAIYKQSIGDPRQDGLCVWDYHVVLIAKPATGDLAACTCGSEAPALSTDKSPSAKACPCQAWVYDLDTTLPFPCPMRLYAQEAFRAHLPGGKGLRAKRRERLFRVVGARAFLEHFASDRSHMLAPVEVLDALGTRSEGDDGGAAARAAAAAAVASPSMLGDEGHVATRREVQQEAQTRAAEQASWASSAVADRLPGVGGASSLSLAMQERQYIAPPPPYPPIRTARDRNNLDAYRFFRFPDSGVGIVMSQPELLDFCHVAFE